MVESGENPIRGKLHGVQERVRSFVKGLKDSFGYYTGDEEAVKEVYRSIGANSAGVVARGYRIGEIFGLDPLRVALFESYFAGYYVSKIGHELSFLMKTPVMEVIQSIPLLARVVRMGEIHNRCNGVVVKEYQDLAERQAKEVCRSTAEQHRELADDFLKRIPGGNEATLDFIAKDIARVYDAHEEVEAILKKGRDRFLRGMGHPGALQRAANILSAVYIQSDGFPHRERVQRMTEAIATLKIQEWE